MRKKWKARSILAWLLVVMIMATTHVYTIRAGSIDFSSNEFDFDDILFIKHEYLRATGHGDGCHMCDQYFGFNAEPGGGLFILKDAFSDNPTEINVLENSVCTNGRYAGQKLEGGTFLSPDLSYDGTEILFAYTDANQSHTWNENTTYHIFKVNIDGSNLTQLTDGAYNDFDPCWLPDGKIAFISERRGGYGRCHGRTVPTYTLHTMNDDGSDIRCVSFHETNEWAPSVDNNGMIIWTRWDYIDRGDTQMHCAWIANPDGTDPRPVSGNYVNYNENPKMHMSLRAIPNSNKYVGVAAPHHGQNYGALIMIDPDIEDDDNLAQITNLTPECGYPESTVGTLTDLKYATPYPLSEEYFLCVYDEDANSHGVNKHYSLYVIDDKGNKKLLYDDPSISCLDPIPVKARPIPNAIPVSEQVANPDDGIVNIINVYDSMLDFPEGTVIEGLRIIQVYPKTTPNADDPKISYVGRKNSRGVLGTVPVESDGSAKFYLPPDIPVLFQAIGSDGTAIQTMRSDTFVIGGQKYLSCQGCHEPRHTAPDNPEQVPLAMRREPSVIQPETVSGAKPMSFPLLIQPILDNKCVSCHDGSNNIDLRRGTSSGWFTSYINLGNYVHKFPDIQWAAPRTVPGQFGSNASPLYEKLSQGMGNLTDEELHRFVLWMDTGVAPFYGVYHNTTQQENGEVVLPILE